jgi:hypothetical protein
LARVQENEHVYVNQFGVVENSPVATHSKYDEVAPKQMKGLTSSSKPNAPRLLPMPPEADVEIGALDGSGIILSLILSKNDMTGESLE